MCGRYNLAPSGDAWVDVVEMLGADAAAALAELAPRVDVRPSTPVPVVYRPDADAPPRLAQMRWGLVPHFWSRPELPRLSFNARVETADTQSMWKHAFCHTRALMPATSWIEWQRQVDPDTGEVFINPRTRRPRTVPHLLEDRAGKAFFFAALYARNERLNPQEPLLSCAILTMPPPSAALAGIHDRAPIVLKRDFLHAWLDPRESDPARIKDLLRQGHEKEFLIHRDRRV